MQFATYSKKRAKKQTLPNGSAVNFGLCVYLFCPILPFILHSGGSSCMVGKTWCQCLGNLLVVDCTCLSSTQGFTELCNMDPQQCSLHALLFLALHHSCAEGRRRRSRHSAAEIVMQTRIPRPTKLHCTFSNISCFFKIHFLTQRPQMRSKLI